MRSEVVGTKERFRRWLDRKRGRPIEWDLSDYLGILGEIDRTAQALELGEAPDGSVRERARALRVAALDADSLDALLPEAFALAREAASRTIRMRPFDVQMAAAVALFREHFVEMQTGEGKTLAAVLPAFLRALGGEGVHVLTFNDYLAKRDALWMAPVYEYLGLRVGYVVSGMSREERRKAYDADVTYITAREAGYDYLRQSLATDKEDLVMRPFNFAIVDEADSILIDEARVPLVIAGNEPDLMDDERVRFDKIAAELKADVHYALEENERNIYLTQAGIEVVQGMIDCPDLLDANRRDQLTLIHQALHARVLLKRDVDYIVREGRVAIVDEFTGRVVADRHWPDGLQRAVEAKERVAIEDQGTVLNSITIQHFMRLYPALCGMSGTLVSSEAELHYFFGITTVVIPPNRTCIRADAPDVLFTHEDAKMDAVVKEVVAAHRTGRPILIGTGSVEESEALAHRLKQEEIPCSVLNARNDEDEAAVIADAGALGAVTVSTNMAGRGTDIMLGGKGEGSRAQVVETGGLYVIGTGRFESRRVDRQLRGRAGRQGDPGSSRFFVSLEDPLMRRFNVAQWIPKGKQTIRRAAPIEDPVVHEKIALVQRIAEGQNLEIRKNLFNYTSFVEKQRIRIQAERDQLLLGPMQSHLAERCSERYTELLSRVGPEVLKRVEAQIRLFHLDQTWCSHLADIADLREGIYLRCLGGESPLRGFVKSASELFEEMQQTVDARVKETFETVSVTADGIDLEKEGLKGPSSTWTYLVNENPFQWMGSLSEMGNVGFGIATGIYFGFVFSLQSLYRKITRRS